ncbi:hypothetical protein A2U01_0063635, partial [Trifolium medium]|nr:hypothetical protein [Trifolium medium]
FVHVAKSSDADDEADVEVVCGCTYLEERETTTESRR